MDETGATDFRSVNPKTVEASRVSEDGSTMHDQRQGRQRVDSRGCAAFRSLHRRQAIQVGVCGALGLTLGDLLRWEALGQESASSNANGQKPVNSGTQAFSAAGSKGKIAPKALSVIQLHLG